MGWKSKSDYQMGLHAQSKLILQHFQFNSCGNLMTSTRIPSFGLQVVIVSFISTSEANPGEEHPFEFLSQTLSPVTVDLSWTAFSFTMPRRPLRPPQIRTNMPSLGNFSTILRRLQNTKCTFLLLNI